MRLEAALSLIVRHPAIRRRAVELARAEVERDTQQQAAAGIVYVTPAAARVWTWQRLDGAIVAVPDHGGAYLL